MQFLKEFPPDFRDCICPDENLYMYDLIGDGGNDTLFYDHFIFIPFSEKLLSLKEYQIPQIKQALIELLHQTIFKLSDHEEDQYTLLKLQKGHIPSDIPKNSSILTYLQADFDLIFLQNKVPFIRNPKNDLIRIDGLPTAFNHIDARQLQ